MRKPTRITITDVCCHIRGWKINNYIAAASELHVETIELSESRGQFKWAGPNRTSRVFE